MDAHDLTAAYALDALGPEEAEAYERHLAQCEKCREQLAELNATAASLAYGAEAPAPPARLRTSILEAAAAERANVVPLMRRRWVSRGLAIAAAAVACVAVGLGVALTRSSGTKIVTAAVVVGPSRTATLRISGLDAAPRGKTYEAWVIPPGRAAKPAGLFPGGANATVRLRSQVPRHAVIAVTLERAGGAKAPTQTPIITAGA